MDLALKHRVTSSGLIVPNGVMLQPHTLANDNRAATAGCNNLQLMPHNELTELGSVPVLLALLAVFL